MFTEFCGNVARGPRKNSLDFGGNLDHVRLRLEEEEEEEEEEEKRRNLLCIGKTQYK